MRQFAGVNVIVFGDLFQLDPTGSKSFMSNPFDKRTKEQATIRLAMITFWGRGTISSAWELRPWNAAEPSRVAELSVNQRSGADVWFSTVLDECRAGHLTEDNYNFLHGLPTSSRTISFWYHRRCEDADWHKSCSGMPYCMDFATFESTKVFKIFLSIIIFVFMFASIGV